MDFFLLKENFHFYFMSIIVQVVLCKHREKIHWSDLFISCKMPIYQFLQFPIGHPV